MSNDKPVSDEEIAAAIGGGAQVDPQTAALFGKPEEQGQSQFADKGIPDVNINIPVDQPSGPDAPGTEDGLLLGKFKTTEDLAKAYQELEQKQSRADQPRTEGGKFAPKSDGKIPEAGEEGAPENIEILNKWSQAYHENGGQMPEEGYAELEAAGYPKHVVDTYAHGVQALGRERLSAIAREVGGPDTYDQMIQWAANNLTPEQASAYNAVVDAHDPANPGRASESALLAVRGLYAQWQQKTGGAMQPLGGNQSRAPQVEVFRSQVQVTEAMSDPRYHTDPAYREAVAAKLAASMEMKTI